MKALAFAAALIMSAPLGAAPIAITNATVWTMTSDRPLDNATIVIDHGRILSIETRGRVPEGAVRISADHRIVTPSLVDAATQIGLGEVGGIDEERRGRVDSGPLGAAFSVAYGFDADDQAVRQARADGVGWAMIYPDGSAEAPFDGTAASVALGAHDARIERSKAAMLVTISGSSAARVGGSTAAAWQLLRNALDEAGTLGLRSANRSRDGITSRLDAAALRPVFEGSMPLIIQCDRLSDIRQAIGLVRDFRLRLIIFGGAEAWAAARELAEARIPVILDPMASLPDSYDRVGARPDSAALLAASGVHLAFSVSAQGIYRSWDAGPSMREGAGLAVASGLSYAAALRAITSDAAAIVGLPRGTGTLGAGGQANLVMWDGDPLEPSTGPALVMIDGQKVPLVTRQTQLRDRYAPSH